MEPPQSSPTPLLTSLCVLVGGQLLVAPVLLRVVPHGAPVRLHLLVQATAVDEDGLAGLRVPAPLSKHLLQLLDGVAALPLADTVLLHSAVTPPQGLWGRGREITRMRYWNRIIISNSLFSKITMQN